MPPTASTHRRSVALRRAVARWLRRFADSADAAAAAAAYTDDFLDAQDAALVEAARCLLGDYPAESAAGLARSVLDCQLGPRPVALVDWHRLHERLLLLLLRFHEGAADAGAGKLRQDSPLKAALVDAREAERREEALSRARLLTLVAAYRRRRLRSLVLESAVGAVSSSSEAASGSSASAIVELRLLAAACRWLFATESRLDDATTFEKVAAEVLAEPSATSSCPLVAQLAELQADALDRELRHRRRFEAFAEQLAAVEKANKRLLADPRLMLKPDCGLALLQEEIKSLRRAARLHALEGDRDHLRLELAGAASRCQQLERQLDQLTRCQASCLRRARRAREDRDRSEARADRLAERCRRLECDIAVLTASTLRSSAAAAAAAAAAPPPPPFLTATAVAASSSSSSSPLMLLDRIPVRDRRPSNASAAEVKGGGGGGGWRHLLPGRLSGKRKS